MTFIVRHVHIPATTDDSLSIAHLSDLHVWTGNRLLSQLEAHLERDPPDVVAFTGDGYDLPAGARLFEGFLRRVASRWPVVWVLGNHERLWRERLWKPLTRLDGCHFLTEASCTHTVGNTRFEFVDLPHAAAALDPGTIRIALHHDPEDLPAQGVDGTALALAGHLHGGQVVWWKNRAGALFPGSWLYRNLSDKKRLGSTWLVVNRGLGDSLPIRWNCPHEVVRIRLGGNPIEAS
jgi:predicted MPP superfamily phosphohydrolase